MEERLSSSLEIDWVNELVSGRLEKLPDRFLSRDILRQMYSGLEGRGNLIYWTFTDSLVGSILLPFVLIGEFDTVLSLLSFRLDLFFFRLCSSHLLL